MNPRPASRGRRSQDPQQHLPLPAHVLQILLVLAERPHHGYALLDAIEHQTGGELSLGTSTLYASLSRLLKSGLIEDTAAPADAESEDARRRYYGLTGFGHEVLRAEGLRIRRLNRLISDAGVIDRPVRSRGRA